MNVLIVDDSKAIYSMVSQMLQEGGHASIWATDGIKAFEILAQNSTINLILLDWNMPNMNGLEFLEKNFKEKLTTVPIIVMTTENSAAHFQKALSLSAAEYIMKPFTKDVLFHKMLLAELID